MLLLAMCAALQAGVAVDSPPQPIRQLVHTSWTAKDGAPTEIRALAQDGDGYLWIGAVSGLVRFDGVRFVPFTPQGGDTLPAGGIRRLLAARDGSLWIGWRSGAMSRLHKGRLQTFTERDGLPLTFDVTESSAGLVVVATRDGLFRFDGKKWHDAGPEWLYPGGRSQAVWFDRDDGLWAGAPDRMLYLPPGGREFTDPGMLLTSFATQMDFGQDRAGATWMAEMTRSAHTLPPIADQPPSEVMLSAWTLLIDRRGSLWIGSLGDGLRRVLDPTRIRGRRIERSGPEAEHYSVRDGLLSDVVLALAEDREGSVWVGSARGLERFHEGAFLPMVTPGSVGPRSLFTTRDSSVWVTSYTMAGLYRITPRGQGWIDSASGWQVHNLTEDAFGAVWTAVGGSIYRLQRGRFVEVPLRKQFPMVALRDILVDQQGTVWVYDGYHGLLRLDGDSLAVEASFPSSTISTYLRQDRRGRFWAGMFDVVRMYDHGQAHTFRAAEGKAPMGVNGYLEDRAGSIWVTGEAGLSRFENGRFRTLPERQGVPGRSILGVVEDRDGAWWLATPRGVLRLPPGEADRAMADSGHALRYRSFTRNDGIPGEITGTMWGPLVSRAADGRIWVAADSGVASIDPGTLPPDEVPPVTIEALRVDGREQWPLGGAIVAPRPHDIELDYTALSLSKGERIQFRYQLLGEDESWHEVGTRRRAYFTGLGPGRYTFRVESGTADGGWHGAVSSLDFRILPAWYQTLWLKALAVLLIAGISGLGVAAFQRRQHRRAESGLHALYEAKLTERARIAQDLHDTLMQGFAGVTLQLKAVELSLPDRPDATARLGAIQDLARDSLREARERVWEMRDTATTTEDLPAALETIARERTSGHGIDVSLHVTGVRRKLVPVCEDAVFRIGREAIVNAVQHAGAHRIEIALRYGETSLVMEVRDDGRGFTPIEGEDARRKGHFGLSGMRDRASHVRGRCEIRARPEGGTVVSVELPIAD